MTMLAKGRTAFTHDAPPSGIFLNLTALMDILSNLLFFLLASYSTQDAEIKQKHPIELPASSSELQLVESLTVTVTTSQILVAGLPVAEIDGGAVKATEVDNGKIVALYDKLASARANRKAAGRDGDPGSDTVLLLADKTLDTTLITDVLKTSAMAGFPNVRFGVIGQ